MTERWQRAEGTLEQVPFAHLVVYVHEQRLTGALALTSPTRASATVVFARGTLAKVALSGRTSVAEMDEAIVLHRLVQCFGFAPQSSYAFDSGLDPLPDGESKVAVDPYPALWCGIRKHASPSQIMSVLGRIGDAPVRLVADAQPERFRFDARVRAAVECLRGRAMSVIELAKLRVVEPEDAARLLYTLVITKHAEAARTQHEPPLEAIEAHLARGERDIAETLCRRACASRPEDPRPLVLLGRALTLGVSRDQDRVRQALAAFSRALQMDPDNVDAHLHRGILYKRTDQHAAALRDLRSAKALAPSHVEVLRELRLYELRLRNGTVRLDRSRDA